MDIFYLDIVQYGAPFDYTVINVVLKVVQYRMTCSVTVQPLVSEKRKWIFVLSDGNIIGQSGNSYSYMYYSMWTAAFPKAKDYLPNSQTYYNNNQT